MRSETSALLEMMQVFEARTSRLSVCSKFRKGAGNEYQLTDALRKMCLREGLMALELAGERYDIGDKFGYMASCVNEYA